MPSKVQSLESKAQRLQLRGASAYSLDLRSLYYPLSFIFVSMTLFFGCGYHFSGGSPLPQGIQRMSLAEIENETLEVGAEKELQWALEREFRKRGGVVIADEGEGILNVTMRQLDLRPLSFDRRDQVLEYELVLLIDASLVNRETGQILWQANNMRVTSDYDAIPQVVVTTSPQFLEGNLNAEDLEGMTDIQFSETQRHLAVERLFETVAREVYFRLSENF
ncbi:MAG: LPS assembly lipoprotein LptE [Candidatus Binatia bacterium]